MTEQLIIVGEANPWGGAATALYHLPRHASGNRLREHLGLRDATYEKLRKVNLCEPAWSEKLARVTAERVLNRSGWDWDLIVMLGARVKKAFGVPKMEAFTAQGVLVALPHPSGLCRQWNEPGAPARARQLLARVAPWVPWGEVA